MDHAFAKLFNMIERHQYVITNRAADFRPPMTIPHRYLRPEIKSIDPAERYIPVLRTTSIDSPDSLLAGKFGLEITPNVFDFGAVSESLTEKETIEVTVKLTANESHIIGNGDPVFRKPSDALYLDAMFMVEPEHKEFLQVQEDCFDEPHLATHLKNPAILRRGSEVRLKLSLSRKKGVFLNTLLCFMFFDIKSQKRALVCRSVHAAVVRNGSALLREAKEVVSTPPHLINLFTSPAQTETVPHSPFSKTKSDILSLAVLNAAKGTPLSNISPLDLVLPGTKSFTKSLGSELTIHNLLVKYARHMVALETLELTSMQQDITLYSQYHMDLVTRPAKNRSFGIPEKDQNGDPNEMVQVQMMVPGLSEALPALVMGSDLFLRFAGSESKQYHTKLTVVEPGKNQVAFLLPSYVFDRISSDSSFEGPGTLYPKCAHVQFAFERIPTFVRIMGYNYLLSKVAQMPPFRGDNRMSPDAPFSPKSIALAIFPEIGSLPNPNFAAEMAAFPPVPVGAGNVNASSIFSTSLTQSQANAATTIAMGNADNRPFMCLGVPGSGKTRTLVSAVLHIIQHFDRLPQRIRLNHSQPRILVCAPTHAAADVLLRRFAEALNTKEELVAVFSPLRWNLTLAQDLRQYACMNKAGQFDGADMERVRHAKVVVTTCTSSAMMLPALTLEQVGFTHIIVDEAAQASEGECILPLLLANPGSPVTLAGDFNQLGLSPRNPMSVKYGMAFSLMERLRAHEEYSEGYQATKGRAANDRHQQVLVDNFRSHPAILQVPSRLFYKGTLVSKIGAAAANRFASWEKLPNKNNFPVLMHGVSGHAVQVGAAASFKNLTEVWVLQGLIRSFVRAFPDVPQSKIGVITTFRRQGVAIRNQLRSAGMGEIRVGTMHDFQGQEVDALFVSTVLTSPYTDVQTADSDHHDDVEKKAFNVTVTRGKGLLVVVGSPAYWATHSYWKSLLHHCTTNRAYSGIPVTSIRSVVLKALQNPMPPRSRKENPWHIHL